MERIKGGVTAAKGFQAAGVEANVKYKNRKDMAMIVSGVPCRAAGVFTSNVVKAAPVVWDRELIDNSPYIQAVVVNSGIANACTGRQGYAYCQETAQAAASALHIPENTVLVASTGVIGMQLPMDKITAGVEKLAVSLSDIPEAGTLAAEAIMTTDTISKQVAVQFEAGGKTVTVGGMSKGSGMIHPNMCTMLGFVTTDIAISKELLQEALREDVVDTFNMISVDGDTSTNDTVLLLASGLSGAEVQPGTADYDTFVAALTQVAEQLSRELAGDGEGATKLLECIVTGAPDLLTARAVSKSVIHSALFKAAMFGADANWGRVLCAIGYTPGDFDISKTAVRLKSKAGEVFVCENAAYHPYSEDEAAKVLKEDEIQILVDLGSGDFTAKAWGCDLTYDYVKINGDYRT